jgi:hypothetical protein
MISKGGGATIYNRGVRRIAAPVQEETGKGDGMLMIGKVPRLM